MNLRLFGFFTLTLVCLAILSGAGAIAYWTLDREVPVEVQQIEVLTPEVKPGGSLLIRQRLDYIRECPAHVDRGVYDSATHREFLPDIDYERTPQGLGIHTVTFEVNVPKFFVPGPATYRARPVYTCNILQRAYWPITRPETVVGFRIVQ